MPVKTTDWIKFGQQLNETAGMFKGRMEYVGEQAGTYALFLYRRTVTHWNWPPDFSYRIRWEGKKMLVEAAHDSDIYYMIDVTGARKHPIYPRGPWPLRFRARFSPKTQVGKFVSMRGGSFGPVVYAAYIPEHPGFEPRHYTEEIQERVPPRAVENMERLLDGLQRRLF